MSSGDHDVTSTPLTQDQVLNELEFLASVEHALVVECLTAGYALGYGLDADAGSTTADPGLTAAGVAAGQAKREMPHLRRICDVLASAGRTPALDRASSIPGDPGTTISLDPPSSAELQQLVTREQAIAAAVDARYAQLGQALTSASVPDANLLGQIQFALPGPGAHTTAFAAITDPLAGVAPDAFLRATRRDAADDFEKGLLGVSDQSYTLIVAMLQDQYSQGTGPSVRAVNAMDLLDAIGCVLVRRGLLPPFTS